MTVHASDLTADARRRYGLPDTRPARRPKPSRAGTGDGQPCPGTCSCGQRFGRYTAWERHAAATGHRVWSIELEPA